MNNIRVIICATFALLVAALVYFYVNSSNPSSSDDRSIKELENELAQAYLNLSLEAPSNAPVANFPAPSTNSGFDIVNELSAEEKKAKEEAEINRIADDIERQRLAEEKAKEDELMVEPIAPVDATRQQWITQAQVMAKVTEFNKPNLIVVAQIKQPEMVVPDMILGIRRNTGIIGRLKISSIEDGNAYADVIPASFFGKPVEIQVGDELIVIP